MSYIDDDENVFNFTERELIVEGYCEECSNYDRLIYIDGLYLCETCREFLRGSRAQELDVVWKAIFAGLDAVKSLCDLTLLSIKFTGPRQPVI